MSAAERIVERLERAKRSGDRWSARCPAHDDRTPSLSVANGRDSNAVVFCHGGCETEDVLAALGLPIAALRDEWWDGRRDGDGRRIVAQYDYVDEVGGLLFQVVRFEPKDFRQRRPDGRGGWVWRLGDVRRVLYRLPLVLAAVKQGEIVYVVEGEKDVHAIEDRGVGVATCNPGGASKWRDEYAEALRGARVVVVADDDEKGREHAWAVACSLEGVAASVDVMEPVVGNDVSDHLDAGATLDELVTAEQPVASVRPPLVVPDSIALRFVSLAEFVEVEEPGASALVGDDDNVLVPEGGDVMFYGDGGAGKTTLMIDLALHLAAGDDWLGIAIERPVRVGVVENEGPRPLFRAKLRRKVRAWDGSPVGDRVLLLEDPWGRVSLDTRDVRDALAGKVAELNLDALVVGPVTRSGMNEAGTLQQVRDYVNLLAEVRAASGRRVTFLLAHHENRGGQVSGAWEGAVDTLFHIQAQGHGRTRLHVQKARWSPEHHKRTLHLAWTPGEAFVVTEDPERDDNTIADEILAYVGDHGGTSWGKVETNVSGKSDRLRAIRDVLEAGGQLVNVGSKARGGSQKWWSVDDPARPTTLDDRPRPEGDEVGTRSTSHSGTEGDFATSSPRPDVRRDEDEDAVSNVPDDADEAA